MLVFVLATMYTSCMLCGFLPRLIYLRTYQKKKIRFGLSLMKMIFFLFIFQLKKMYL